MKVIEDIDAAACFIALKLIVAVTLQSSPALAQGVASNRFDDEKLKTSFSISHPVDVPCLNHAGFEGLRSFFLGTDSLEKVLLEMTSRRDLFLESEPDPFLEEQPKLYWLCEVIWKRGGGGSEPSFYAKVYPIDGTMELCSIELRLSQEP